MVRSAERLTPGACRATPSAGRLTPQVGRAISSSIGGFARSSFGLSDALLDALIPVSPVLRAPGPRFLREGIIAQSAPPPGHACALLGEVTGDPAKGGILLPMARGDMGGI
jgi:hypothetical protein